MEPINLLHIFTVLEQRKQQIVKTKSIIEFMTAMLDQKYRRATNSLYWFQLFLNGSWLENAFKTLNPKLSYIEDNHGILGNQARGNFIPDFEFTVDNIRYTLDTKTYLNLAGFNLADTNKFENATFVIAFIMTEKKYYVRINLGSNIYSEACAMDDLPKQLVPTLSWIKLPQTVKMIRFNVKSEQADKDTPEEVDYCINTYKI